MIIIIDIIIISRFEEDASQLHTEDTSQNTNEDVEVVKPKRKRGRNPKNNNNEREWTDDETFKLIDLWSNHECLFNTKSPNYANKDRRNLALDKIVQDLSDFENPPTRSQIQLKITRLRNYYGGENNKVEKSKTSGGSLESVYSPSWKFFDALEFLRDNLVARPSKSNLDRNNDTAPNNDNSVYNVNNPPSTKSMRKMAKSTTEHVMKTATEVLQNISSRYDAHLNENKTVDEDRNLVEMIYTMLKSIPEGMPKAMLRLELQQKIIQLKYSYQVPNTTQTTYQQAASSSNENFFPFMSSPNQSGHSSSSSSTPAPFRPYGFNH